MLTHVPLRAFLAAFIGLATACTQHESADITLGYPKVRALKSDNSTPDRAVQSYWALQDAEGADNSGTLARLYREGRHAPGYDLRLQLLGGDALRSYLEVDTVPETILREILTVRTESESRAVVVARLRNATPIPEGAEVDKWDREKRQSGNVIEYIPERFADGWKIVQAKVPGFGLRPEPRNHWDPDRKYVPTLVSP